MESGPIHLHLRLRVKRGEREAFLAFLREAAPFYESPGGIRIGLLQDAADDHRFIEVVEYQDRAAYERDQKRIEEDPQMRSYLARWRTLLEETPQVEVYAVQERIPRAAPIE
jgi:quinol monooxygenase YgiN